MSTQNTKNKVIQKYPFFHLYIIFSFISGLLIFSGGLYVYQYKNSIELVSTQLVKIQTQLSENSILLAEQTTLLSAIKLSEEMLNNEDISDYLLLQKSFSQVYKKLILFKSENHATYQHWQDKRQGTVNLHPDIELNGNKLLQDHKKLLMQLSAFKLRVNELQGEKKYASQQKKLFVLIRTVNDQISLLSNLTLITSPKTFEELSKLMLILTKQLSAVTDSQAKNDKTALNKTLQLIVNIEPLYESVLTQWQENIGSFRVNNDLLKKQNLVFTQLLYNLNNPEQNISLKASAHLSKNIFSIVDSESIVREVFTLITAILFITACCFWFIYRHGKRHLIRQFQLQLIAQAKHIKENFQPLASALNDNTTFKNEAIKKIGLINDQGRLKPEGESSESISLKQQNINAIAAQKNDVQLHGLILKQSEELVLTSLSNKSETQKQHLFEAFLLGKALRTRLNQVRVNRFIQTDGFVLKPTNVNLISSTEALLLNKTASMKQKNNGLIFEVDGGISSEVSIDVDIYSELIQIFTHFLCNSLTDSKFYLSLQLEDKSDKEQKIRIVGKISSSEEILQLPTLLQKIQDQENDNSEIINYFDALLLCLDGDNVFAELIDTGYQFSFSLPVDVAELGDIGADTSLEFFSKPSQLSTEVFDIAITNYQIYPRPIEVLIGVNSPFKYQKLQDALQTLGFQVTFVAQEDRQKEYWQSGRYVILISEFLVSPFVSFSYEENSSPLSRGVFCLRDKPYITPKDEKFSHWKIDELTLDVSAYEIVQKIAFWLSKQRAQDIVEKNQVQDPLKELLIDSRDAKVFDLNQYIKNQGTAELAFLMLDEYLNEIRLLINKVAVAIEQVDLPEVEENIHLLKQISKILATKDLLKLCQDWHEHISDPVLNQNAEFLNKLLSKTKQEILNIESYVDAI